MSQGPFRNNFTKGVLDPELAERPDLQQHDQSLLTGRNIEVLPKGGFRRAAGSRSRGRLRRKLRRIPTTTAMFAVPKGGTASLLGDQQFTTRSTTTAAINSDPWVFVTVDLQAATTVAAVDLIGFVCGASGADNAVQVQSSTDNASWSDFGTAFNIRTTARNRRAALPPGQIRTARYWRVALKGQPAVTNVGIAELRFMGETAEVSRVKRLRFAFSTNETYELVATDRNVDIFRGGIWQASASIPHRSDQLRLMNCLQSLDTAIIVHEDVVPWSIVRSGGHDEWNWGEQALTNVPTITSVTAFGVAQSEVQEITIDGIANGSVFTIEQEGIVSANITKTAPGTEAALAAAIDAAMEAMPNIGVGMTVAVLELTATRLRFKLTYGFERVWPPTFVDVVTAPAVVTVTTLQEGRAASGAVISKELGYPRAGCFFQGRVWLAGMKTRPSSLLGSKVNSFDFALSPVTSDAGLLLTLDSDQVPTILQVYAGRHLQIFTDIGEFYVTNRAIDATQTQNVVQATPHGIEPGVAPVAVAGVTLFNQIGGYVLREFVFDQGQEDYTAEPLSTLASNLLTGVIACQVRQSRTTEDGDRVYLVNAAGNMASLAVWKAQSIVAFTERVEPQGAYRDVGVDAAGEVYFYVERTVAGQADLWLQQLDDSLLLAAALTGTALTPTTTISLLEHLEGLSVGVIGDGDFLGTYTVSGGQVTLPVAVSAYEVGLVPEVVADLMPVRRMLQDATIVDLPMRVHGVVLQLRDTGHLAVQANKADVVEVPLPRLDTVEPLTAMAQRLFTGEVRLGGLLGRQRAGHLAVLQPVPAPLEVSSIELMVR